MKDLTSSRNGRNCSDSTFHSGFEDSHRDEEEKRPSFLCSRGASVSTLLSFILYIGAMEYCCLCSAMIETDCARRAYYIPSIVVANPTEPAHLASFTKSRWIVQRLSSSFLDIDVAFPPKWTIDSKGTAHGKRIQAARYSTQSLEHCSEQGSDEQR